MTKIELHFKVGNIDSAAMAGLATLSAIYGILRVNYRPGSPELTVEYDATRLRAPDVEAALARTGISAELVT